MSTIPTDPTELRGVVRGAQEETAACCSTSAQATCCESSAKSECCNTETHAAGTCGCSQRA